MAIKFRKPYDPQVRHPQANYGVSLTKQQFKQECDINYILRKYQKTGLIDHVARYQGNYSDISDVPSYQDALNTVLEANLAFSTLPSSLRKRFSNDPEQFLSFVADPANAEELYSLGLATKPLTPSPTEPLSVADSGTPDLPEA